MLRRGGRRARGSGGGDGSGRRPGLLALGLLVLLLPACASVQGSGLSRPSLRALPATSPLHDPTLALGDAWLRHHLHLGQPHAALELFDSIDGPLIGDDLLAALQRALVLREAGEFERSTALLEWADVEAEARSVTSVSRTAGSFILNDRILSYVPSPGEAAMIPYYRAMNHLELGDLDAAAVEARRIGALLEGLDASPERRCGEEAMLRHLAALIFDAAGEMNDALVAARLAEATYRGCEGDVPAGVVLDLNRLAGRAGLNEVVDSVRARYASILAGDLTADTTSADDGGDPAGYADTGELVLFLERGFIAHRREAALHVPIFESEIEVLGNGRGGAVAEVAAEIAARLLVGFTERGYWGSAWGERPRVQVGRALGGAHILRLAWVGIEEQGRLPTLQLSTGSTSLPATPYANLSRVVRAEVDAERAAALTRLMTRALAKYAVSRRVERKAEKQGGELAGFLAGRLANLAANESERADTRSWTLLPGRIDVVRVRLPAGTHALRLQVHTGADALPVEWLDLGEVDVYAGKTTLLSRRDGSGVRIRLSALTPDP